MLLLLLGCRSPEPARMILDVEAPGLSAEEVELQVLMLLEADLLGRASHLESWAWPDSGRLVAYLEQGSSTEPPRTLLPEGVQVELQVLRQPEQRASLVFTDPEPDRARLSAEDVALQLRRTPCVHSVTVVGAQRGLTVSVDPARLAAHGLTFTEVLEDLAGEPWDKAVIRGVPLVDLATFEQAPQAPWVLYDGHPAVLLQILGQGCEDLDGLLAGVDGQLLPSGDGDVRVTGSRGEDLKRFADEARTQGSEHQLLVWDERRASLRVTTSEPGEVALALQRLADQSPGSEASVHGLPSIEVVLQGERGELQAASNMLRAQLEQLGRVDGGQVPLEPVVRVRTDREAAARYGVSTRDVVRVTQPQRLEQGTIALDGTWEHATVRSLGGPVPLRALADIELAAEPAELYRDNARPALILRVRTSDRAAVLQRIDGAELPPGVSARVPE